MDCGHDLTAQWTTVLNVAMHFNEMLVSTRSLVASVTTAVFGAAAVSAIHLKPEIARIGKTPVGVFILAGGLLFLICMFVFDHFYYYQLLLASVDVAEAMEHQCKILPSLTLELTKEVSRNWASVVSVAYYAFLAACELIFAFIILRWDRTSLTKQAGTPMP